MRREEINDRYFDWLLSFVGENRYSPQISFRKLLTRLHDVEFTWLLSRDENRAEAGADLRYRFALRFDREHDPNYITDVLEGPCSVLEMMIALAIYCEESIMDDPSVGNRTGQWFWRMIVNLGLGSMVDSNFDREYVDEVLERFLNREYEPDGRGGLFTIRNCDRDLRDVEIFYQLCWYLDTIIT